MTSQDNQQFITVDVFNARMDRLEAVMEKNIAIMREENAKFREQIKDEMHNGFDKVHSEIAVIQKDLEGVKHDINGLYHWDYWLLSIILALFVLPQFSAGIKSFFSALTSGITGIIALFGNKNKNS